MLNWTLLYVVPNDASLRSSHEFFFIIKKIVPVWVQKDYKTNDYVGFWRISCGRDAPARCHLKCEYTEKFARMALRQIGEIYLQIFRLVELVFFSQEIWMQKLVIINNFKVCATDLYHKIDLLTWIHKITQFFKFIFASRGSGNSLTNNLFCIRVMWSGIQVCLHSLDILRPLCTTRTTLLRRQELSLQVSACESADQKTSG